MIDRGMVTAWLAVACLAPSPHNNQPWLVRAAPDGVIMQLDLQQIPVLGPDLVQFVALGAFISFAGFCGCARDREAKLGLGSPTVACLRA